MSNKLSALETQIGFIKQQVRLSVVDLTGFHFTVPNLVLPHWYLGRMQTKDLVYI